MGGANKLKRRIASFSHGFCNSNFWRCCLPRSGQGLGCRRRPTGISCVGGLVWKGGRNPGVGRDTQVTWLTETLRAMDTAARVWVSVEKDVWQAALLLSRTKDTAEVIIEKGGWVLDPSTSSPGLKWASQYGQVAGASGSGNNGSAGIPESTRGHPTVISLAQATLVLRNPEHLEGIDDLVKLQFLDEPNIIHNLSLRYSTGKIYTNTGPILIAVNPWRNLYIYSPEVMDMYKGRGTPGELPPHVFSVADNAYRAMLREQRNQVCDATPATAASLCTPCAQSADPALAVDPGQRRERGRQDGVDQVYHVIPRIC